MTTEQTTTVREVDDSLILKEDSESELSPLERMTQKLGSHPNLLIGEYALSEGSTWITEVRYIYGTYQGIDITGKVQVTAYMHGVEGELGTLGIIRITARKREDIEPLLRKKLGISELDILYCEDEFCIAIVDPKNIPKDWHPKDEFIALEYINFKALVLDGAEDEFEDADDELELDDDDALQLVYSDGPAASYVVKKSDYVETFPWTGKEDSDLGEAFDVKGNDPFFRLVGFTPIVLTGDTLTADSRKNALS